MVLAEGASGRNSDNLDGDEKMNRRTIALGTNNVFLLMKKAWIKPKGN